MRFEIKDDPDADPLLIALPLRGEVSIVVGNSVNRSGQGKTCGACGKPFNAARQQRAVARVLHESPDGAVFATAWLFCGRCARDIRRNGGRLPAHLVQEARDATAAGLLLARPAGGNA
jgi:hypothetical protein